MVRVQKNGRRRDIGLGGYPKLRLADARKRAADVLRQVELGLDPVAERKRAAGMPSFRQAAAARHRELEKGFRNAKHRAQWLRSLEAHACPVLGDMGIDAIGAAHVREALLPIWLEKPETARRVLQRVADVLAWGVAQGYRDALPLLTAKALRLPKQGRAVVHHAAMPFAEVPAFIARLRADWDRRRAGRVPEALSRASATRLRTRQDRLLGVKTTIAIRRCCSGWTPARCRRTGPGPFRGHRGAAAISAAAPAGVAAPPSLASAAPRRTGGRRGVLRAAMVVTPQQKSGLQRPKGWVALEMEDGKN